MGIRILLEKYQNVSIACTGLAIVLCVASVVYQMKAAVSVPNVKQAFYSIDDGKTWFVDSADRLSPFDHDGKPACRAYVWKCQGHKFVNYLERRTEDANKKMMALRSRGPVVTEAAAAIDRVGLQVKRPGDPDWHAENDPKFTDTVTPRCPEGGSSDDLEPVYP